MSEQQPRHKNYPCKMCDTLSIFVESQCPPGKWICTNSICSQCRITDDDMKIWEGKKKKLEASGEKLQLGMKIIWKNQKRYTE